MLCGELPTYHIISQMPENSNMNRLKSDYIAELISKNESRYSREHLLFIKMK